MALPNGHRFAVTFEEVFPAGAYAVSEVEPVRDFEQSTRDHFVQARDKITDERVHQLQVLDADPQARKAQKTVTVKLLAEHQPVLPEPIPGLPATPVEFEGMTATPYTTDAGRLAFSLRATGVRAPQPGTARSASNGSASTGSASSTPAASAASGGSSSTGGKDTSGSSGSGKESA